MGQCSLTEIEVTQDNDLLEPAIYPQLQGIWLISALF